MNRGNISGLIFALFVLISPLINCQTFIEESASVQDYSVKIVTDAITVHTHSGKNLDGYVAEYEEGLKNFRIFLAFEIQKYKKGDWLVVTAKSSDDYIRMSINLRVESNIPVYYALRARNYWAVTSIR